MIKFEMFESQEIIKISNNIFSSRYLQIFQSPGRDISFFFSKLETQHCMSIHSHRRASFYACARLKSTMAASFGVCRLRLRSLGGFDRFYLGLETQTQRRLTSTISAIKAQAGNNTGNTVSL